MSLLDDLVQVKERESGGTIATDRFDFQANWGLSQVLELHDGPGNYAVAFEFHDDIVVLDDALKPTTATFFQLKTDASKTWTLARLSRRPIKNQKPTSSIAAKMYDSRRKFSEQVTKLVFVSNADASFPPGPFSGAKEADYQKFLTALKAEVPDFNPGHASLFEYSKSKYNLTSYESAILGDVVKFVVKHASLHSCNYRAFYLGMIDECRRRSKNLSNIADFKSLLNSKFITRSDVTAWINALVQQTISQPTWEHVVSDLSHLTPMKRAAIKKAWHRYEQDRLSGLDFTTLELRAQVRYWCEKQANPEATMPELLEDSYNKISNTKAYQNAQPKAEYLAAITIFEMYANE